MKISEALMINSTLTTLNLGCDDKDRKAKERITKKMNEWTGNNIGDEGAIKISEALMINTTLTTLNLSSDDKNKEKKEWITIKWMNEQLTILEMKEQ